jgi:D-arabinose 1-dehydrogenase-like Zn-dependent alcohol dehydrogenase
VNRAGAYSSHLLVPDPKYLIDIGGIDDSFAATLACSALTAYSAARKLPELRPQRLGGRDRLRRRRPRRASPCCARRA